MRISYPKSHSQFLSPIKNAIQRDRDALFAGTPITVTLPPGGYSGNIQVTIEKTNPQSFWADWEYEAPTRFPQRIKVAAWALLQQGCFGEFEISHDKSRILTIRYISGDEMMELFKKEGKNAEYAAVWNKGVALGNSERYEEAIKCFDKAVEIDPNFEELVKEAKNEIKHATTIERAIYDPCKRDFIEGRLPRMKEWINRYDPGA